MLTNVMRLFFCILTAYGSSRDVVLLRAWQPAAAMPAATQQHFAAAGGEKTCTSG